MNAYDIIIRPVITERTMDQMAENKYTFRVAKSANKVQIREAVEKIFGVTVQSVNTMNISGKKRRQGWNVGKSSDWKKAIVTLTPESKSIEFFDSL